MHQVWSSIFPLLVFQHGCQKKWNSNWEPAEKESVCFPKFTQFPMHSLLNENKPTSSFHSSYLPDDAWQINPRKLKYSKILVHTFYLSSACLSFLHSFPLCHPVGAAMLWYQLPCKSNNTEDRERDMTSWPNNNSVLLHIVYFFGPRIKPYGMCWDAIIVSRSCGQRSAWSSLSNHA